MTRTNSRSSFTILVAGVVLAFVALWLGNIASNAIAAPDAPAPTIRTSTAVLIIGTIQIGAIPGLGRDDTSFVGDGEASGREQGDAKTVKEPGGLGHEGTSRTLRPRGPLRFPASRCPTLG